MKRIVAIILALVLLTTPVTAQTCDLSKAKTERTVKEGIYVKGGHYYLYKNSRMQFGEIKYKGRWYYAHKTGSKAYPKGSLTKGQFRIKSGNRWYAYCIRGYMYTRNTYIRKGRFRRYIDLEIRKDRTVRYVYNSASTVRGSIRYSTAERRLQQDVGFNEWRWIEGMQFIPDGWVDWQE